MSRAKTKPHSSCEHVTKKGPRQRAASRDGSGLTTDTERTVIVTVWQQLCSKCALDLVQKLIEGKSSLVDQKVAT